MIRSWLRDAGPNCNMEFIHKFPIVANTKIDSTNPWWTAFSEACGKM